MSCEMLQKIVELTTAARATGAWRFLERVSSARQLIRTGSSLLETLAQEFPQEQLESARILIRRPDNQLDLNPVLAGDSVKGLLLRQSEANVPFDFVNCSGALTTNGPPAFDSPTDYLTEKWSRDDKNILVAFTDDDVVVLRMLGIPCTSSAGLTDLSGSQLRSLCGDPHIYRTAAPSCRSFPAVTTGNYRLVLIGWCLADLNSDPSETMQTVVTRLNSAEDVFGLDTSTRIAIWQPSADDCRRIGLAAEFADRNQVRRLISQRVQSSTFSVRELPECTSSRSGTDYIVARRELLRTMSRAREFGFQSPDVSKRLEDFNRSFDSSIVDAIIKDAMSAADSIERSLLLAAAELMGSGHASSPLVQSTQNSEADVCDAFEDPSLRQRLRMIDGLVKIHRELSRNK